MRAVPLALAGLAVAVAFRAGLLNIGAEGQLLMGARRRDSDRRVAGQAHRVCSRSRLMLVCGAIAGGAWAWIAAELRRRFGVLEVISTIMLNFIALSLIGLAGAWPAAGTHAHLPAINVTAAVAAVADADAGNARACRRCCWPCAGGRAVVVVARARRAAFVCARWVPIRWRRRVPARSRRRARRWRRFC